MTLVNPDANQALAFPDGGMTLQGVLAVENNETMRLVNTITNQGTLRVRSTGNTSTLFIGEDGATTVSLTGNGNGDVKLGDAPAFTSFARIAENPGGATLTIAKNLIHGFGDLGSFNRQLTVVNHDRVSADAAGRALNVRAGLFNNTAGALNAQSGGVLQLAVNTLTNTGSLIEAQANSTVRFQATDLVTGGTLKNANNTFIEANGSFELGSATLANLALQGAFVVKDSTALRLDGTIEKTAV